MSIIDFNYSLKNNLPMYYHFLDGYIDPNIGFETSKIYDFILNHKILPYKGDSKINDIKLLKYMITDSDIILNFYDVNSSNMTPKTFNIILGEKLQYDSELMKMFTYCILQVTNDNHATSFVFFIKDDKLFITSFNSGKGIECHDIIYNDGSKNYYSPYMGIEINNDNMYGLKTILSIIIISELYIEIQRDELEKNIIDIIKKPTEYYYYYPESFYNLDKINNLINYFKSINDIKLKDISFDMKINKLELDNLDQVDDIELYYDSKYIYLTRSQNTYKSEKHKYINVKTSKIDYQQKSYYKIIFEMFKIINKPFKLSITKPFDYSKFDFNSNIINKLVLHYAGDYYIYYQESGSCSWFSIYWPLIFYNIFNFNEQNYYTTILLIYEKMIFLVNRTFNDKSLYLCFKNDSNNNFMFMKLLCEKFINIRLLNYELLLRQTDYIYREGFLINFNKIEPNDSTIINEFISEDKIIDKTIVFGSYYIILLIINSFNSGSYDIDVAIKKQPEYYRLSSVNTKSINNINNINIGPFNDTIKFITELFIFGEIKNLNLFNETAPKLSKFKDTLDELKIKNPINLDKINLDNLFIGNKDRAYQNIENYLKQFIDTYDESIKEPIYIKNYIHWSTTINLGNEFENLQSNNELHLKFIKFIHRFTLFILILKSINHIIHESFSISLPIFDDTYDPDETFVPDDISDQMKKQYIEILYNNIIIPLLNNKEGDFIYPNRIKINDFLRCYIRNIYYDINYLNHLINYEDIENPKPSITRFETFTRSLDDYYKLKDFLYKNPIYIHQDFNNNQFVINTNQFVKLNIKEIFSNDLFRNNLIVYYSVKYYEKKNNDIDNELFWIISNLQLLITGKVGYIEYSKIPDVITYFAFVYEYSKFSFNQFKIILEDIFNNKTKEQFTEHLILNKGYMQFKIISLIKLHIKEEIFYDDTTNEITIGSEIYEEVNIETSRKNLINDYFNIITGNVYLLNKTKKDFYILNDNLYIQFFCNIQNVHSSKYHCKINNIKINNEDVINNELIFYPFKYTIPIICNHLIYKKNNIFHIKYFINDIKINDEINLIGKSSIDKGIYDISINKDNMMFPNHDDLIFKSLCLNFGINMYNIIYLHYPENIESDDKTKYSLTYYNKKYYNTFNFNKSEFMNSLLMNINYQSLQLLNNKPDSVFKMENNQDSTLNRLGHEIFSKSIKKLSFKINKCLYKISTDPHEKIKSYSTTDFIELNKYIIDEMNKLKRQCEIEIFMFSENIKYKNFNYLFDNYSELYNYLLSIKKINLCNVLLEMVNLGKLENFCSQIKIYNEMFKIKKHKFQYNFEAMFELISGNEIYDEQMERYTQIVSDHNIFMKLDPYQLNEKNTTIPKYILDYTQKGGKSYPLHHFMMAKGKSSTITPLLSLYFSKINNKKVFIIVPDHLVLQTNDTISGYIDVFDFKKYVMETNQKKASKITLNQYIQIFRDNDILIFSDSKIKELFLLKLFSDEEYNRNVIMLIDEFDYILDPIKSNFNITNDKDISVIDEFNLLNPVGTIEENTQSIYEGNINKPLSELIHNIILKKSDKPVTKYIIEKIVNLIKKDIKNIVYQIKIDKLKENINWGIHPERGIAIPFRCKDTPLLTSNFSSIFLTIYLTLYYYICIKKYKVTESIINFMNFHNIFEDFFLINKPNILSIEVIEKLLKKGNEEYRLEFYNFIFKHIFDNFKIASNQYNTSFVDILNIDNIYKIGYSGTININLPLLNSEYKFDVIVPDYDEKVNVEYAILNSKVISYLNKDDSYFFEKSYIDFNNYHAIIDIVGLFKNKKNEEIAKRISTFFNINLNSRDVIFISENNEKYVIRKDHSISKYDKFYYYDNPFIYYSQSHIVGIDIKQDLYPTMKGLCIIDKLSEYSEVAQGIFRLRKINMGHSIDFLLLDEYVSSEELLCILNNNEEQSKQEKKTYLIYQTIKSIIRKKTENYIEPIKYYHINYDENISEILRGIISPKDFQTYNLNQFTEINNLEIIKKLVYNLDSCSTSNEQSNEKSNEQSKASSIELSTNTLKSAIIFDELFYDYNKYDFNILDNLKDFNFATIELTNDINYLPNIFTISNPYIYSKNSSGFLFVYFINYQKILIIPGYLIMYFYEKYPIFNFKFILINNNFSKLYNDIKDHIKTKFLKSNLFRLLNYQNVPNINNLSAYICSLMINNNNKISETQKELIKFFLNEDNSLKYKKLILLSTQNKYFIENKIKLINAIEIELFLEEKIKLEKLNEEKIKLEKLDKKKIKLEMKKKVNYEQEKQRRSFIQPIKQRPSKYNEKYYKEKALKYKLKYINLKNQYFNPVLQNQN